MFKILQIILISIFSFQSFADYSAKVYLESSSGGNLPDGSIKFSNAPITPPNYSTADFSQDKTNAICNFNVTTPDPWDNYGTMETWYITLVGSPPTTWSGYFAKVNVNGTEYSTTMPMYTDPKDPYNISGIDFFPGSLRFIEYESKTDNFRVWATNLTTYSLDDYYIIGQYYEICHLP